MNSALFVLGCYTTLVQDTGAVHSLNWGPTVLAQDKLHQINFGSCTLGTVIVWVLAVDEIDAYWGVGNLSQEGNAVSGLGT
jgi:hypothetical protein